MKLFNGEKDLIHRILNLILIVWLVGAIFFSYSNLVNIIVKDKELTYAEYKINNCGDYSIYAEDTDVTISDEIDYCKSQYAQYKFDLKNTDYNNKKSLAYAVGNVVIVGAFLFFLNKPNKKNS